MTFLGHIISKDGVKVNPVKVEGFLSGSNRKIPTEVRSFIGLAGYYQRFIKNFSKIARPMTELTKKSEKFIWSPKCEDSFQELRDG